MPSLTSEPPVDRVLFDTSSTVRPSSDAGSEPPAEEVEIADPATTLARPHRSTLSPSTPCDDGASAVSLSNARPSAPLLDWNVELQRIVSSDDPAAIAREQHEAGVDGREARAVISAARADLEARLARTRLAVKRLRDLEAELEGQEQG